MIVENQLDHRAGWIGSIKKLEEFDELPAAVAISDEGMNLPGEQIDPGQQTERAMAFVLMITREGRVDAGYRRQIGRGCCDGLDSRFFVIGDDRYRLARFLKRKRIGVNGGPEAGDVRAGNSWLYPIPPRAAVIGALA